MVTTWRIHLKRPWCWERLKAGGEGDDRGWDGWMVSPTQWIWVWGIWVWVNSGSWWWVGRAGVLQSMGSQRVRHDWATELNWTDKNACYIILNIFLCTFNIVQWQKFLTKTPHPHTSVEGSFPGVSNSRQSCGSMDAMVSLGSEGAFSGVDGV